MNTWFPIHLHYYPKDLAKPAGAIVAIECDKGLLRKYYGSDCGWGTISGFIEAWPRLALSTGLEGVDVQFSIEGYLDSLDVSHLGWMRRNGLSVIQLHHWGPTKFFDPAEGPTAEGNELLSHIMKNGMWLDLSHLQGRLLQSVLDRYCGKRIVSHVVCKELLEDGVRSNALTDEELYKCKADLYGVPFVDDLLSKKAELQPEERTASIKTIGAHIAAIADIVGPDRVALGPDYFDSSILPENIAVRPVVGSNEETGLLRLRSDLETRGMSESEIDGIFGENAARVFLQKKEMGSLGKKLAAINPDATKAHRYCEMRLKEWLGDMENMSVYTSNVLVTVARGEIPPELTVFHSKDPRVLDIIERAGQILTKRGVSF